MFLLDLPLNNHFEWHELLKVICNVLQVWPDVSGTAYLDCKKHIKACEWFRIYEIIEGIFKLVHERTSSFNPGACLVLARAINNAFIEQNIGWQLADGKVIMRGNEAFEKTMRTAVDILERDAKPTAGGHLRAAVSALSARPKANTSGAVAHATSAVECVLGEITGQKRTLGKYLAEHSAVFHPALRKALDGVYGYASDQGARHGKEGIEPSREEAEFVVATCAASCTLLTQKRVDQKQ
jgi:hypothetical protein